MSTHEATLAKERERLATLRRDTPQQQHKARELEDQIRKTENKITELKAIDPATMRKRDAEARAPYEQQINHTYYTSSKFLHQTASAACVAGFAMGTRQMLGMVMAEVWCQLVKAIKLMIFNPDQLSFVEVCQAVTSLLSVGAATVVGSMAYAQLLPVCSFPFGAELAVFASALVTGVITLGLNYFLLHSGVALKLWAFIDSLAPHAGTLKQFQTLNAEPDRYLAV